jgi:hypothetical protein
MNLGFVQVANNTRSILSQPKFVFGGDTMVRRLIASTVAGEIVYYILLWVAWMLLGSSAFFLGWIAGIVTCIINPLLCAHVASQVTAVQRRLRGVVVWLVLFCLVLVSPAFSNAIWLHASGYYSHAVSNHNVFLVETIAVNQFLNVVGMVIGGIIFIVSFAIWTNREKSQSLRG